MTSFGVCLAITLLSDANSFVSLDKLSVVFLNA